mgnify:CR=1 FL=1
MRNRKGESPMENTNVLFDRKRLVRLIVPLIVEQVLAVTVGMADMVMVSGAGETAVSGISLVNTICVLLIVIFTSMASGGSVVGAQFLGSGDKKTACHAAEQLVMICGLIALVICGISFFGNRWILRVVYGSVEEQVMAYAVEYFFITSLSFPFLGIYNAGAALFRVMGNSNISMVTSIVMNALNIIGNAVFVFGFDMGVAGVALSTLISRAFASVVILVLLHQEKYEIHCTKWFLSMWFVRIALAYLIGVSLHVGLLGVWIAQTLDWVVRAGFYIVRYLGYKWENKSVVRQQEKEILAE